jgi:hypothetical protein
LKAECKAEVIERRRQLMSDFSINEELATGCELEIKNYCDNGKQRGGKTIHCLLGKVKDSTKDSTIVFSSQCLAQVNLISLILFSFNSNINFFIDSGFDETDRCRPRHSC